MRKKDWKWLAHIAKMSMPSSSMYRGVREDHLPIGSMRRLYDAGFITSSVPHNPAHKNRWVITPEGEAALNELKP